MTQKKDQEDQSKYIRNKTIGSFVILVIGFSLAIFGWYTIRHERQIDGQPKTLRKVLKANEKVNAVFFDSTHKVKEYPVTAAAKKVRVNGDVGMGDDFDPAGWKLMVAIPSSDSLKLSMKDIQSLTKRDIVFDFKCIEGWSQVTHWGGARFSDFLQKFKLGTHSGKAPDATHPEDLYKYVGLMTPDKKYYVGIDMKSMLQSQTLLTYEMNAKPLPMDQGFPLRLIIPVKYGIKSLKRIGYIYFSDSPPKDYWHEQGYDYDAAL